MTDPFNHPSPQKENTMYLSTIGPADNKPLNPFYRPSTFLQHDIPGTVSRQLIPKIPHQTNFALSTYVEPIPERSRKLVKTSDPLYIDDIEGSRPRASQFRSNRQVDPLCPKYLLPSASQIVMDKGKKFIRDTLSIQDINGQRSHTWQNRGKETLKQEVEGSSPSKLTRELNAKARLEVKDINKDGIFQSSRSTNPLNPQYNWRDNDDRQLNKQYGPIGGSAPRQMHPTTVNKPNTLSLTVSDIEGTQANSFFARSHFVDKRRQFRNYMATQDIDKSAASTLKKGIVTNRQTNPLMPAYKFPGATEIN